MALQPLPSRPPGAVLFSVRQARCALSFPLAAMRDGARASGTEQGSVLGAAATARAWLSPPRFTPRGNPKAQQDQVGRSSWRHGGLGGGLNTRRSGLMYH